MVTPTGALPPQWPCAHWGPVLILSQPLSLPVPVIWCGLKHSQVLMRDGTLLGCGCGVGGCLLGWPRGSVTFIRLSSR